MPSDLPGRFISRFGRAAAGRGRRALDPTEDPDATAGYQRTLDDFGDTTMDEKYNRTRVGGVLCFPVVAVVAGPDMGAFVELTRTDSVEIGRDPAVGLVLSDPGASRNHARVTWQDDGRFLVEDLGSTNGVLIQGERVHRRVVPPGTLVVVHRNSLMLDVFDHEQILHMGRVNAKLQRAEDRDDLTGLATRRFLDDDLPGLIAAARQDGCYLCCLFLDLDHFKLVNDNFGHQVGDATLSQAARLAVKACRQDDTWVRFGGEEFLGIMPGTDEETAWLAAERVREAIEQHDWSLTHPALRVTCSIGLSRLRPGEPVESWIGRADQALYLAKRNGRNRVERAD
jgi:diguanylate cyclase (GGDEF)-like protein